MGNQISYSKNNSDFQQDFEILQEMKNSFGKEQGTVLTVKDMFSLEMNIVTYT